MPIFKYTVANKEGKKLSGSVEAPEEQTARTELNNLGFSILTLQETQEIPQVDTSLTTIIFEAIDKNSKLVSGTIPAKDEEDAFKKLNTEYSLTVSAIWKKGVTEQQINEARKKGTKKLQEELVVEEEEIKEKSLEHQKEEQFLKTKIEVILKEVNALLQNFDKEFDKDKKAEISKKINKLLRIKHSKNLDYILTTAEDLLRFIEAQEKSLKEKGFQDKRLELQIKTKRLLNELNKTSGPKSISEDILQKIEGWEKLHTDKEKKTKTSTAIIHTILLKIKGIFKTPQAILVIKQQIKVYNKQLWEFAKLYFREPTPKYKTKVKNSIKTIWKARKKAVHSLKQAKKLIKERKKAERIEEHLVMSFMEELNALTGWLLAFYLLYYLVSLYITTKDFGLSSIPKGFYVYESQLFKYILAILFLFHATIALKINFFKKSMVANIVLLPVFVFGSTIVLLNF